MTSTSRNRDLVELCQQAVSISKTAGIKILELFQPGVEVTSKSDDTPLTAADLAANEIIINALTTIDPALRVITEETCDVPYKERSGWCTFWLVDPLDGTREFIKQNGEFSVNIALVHQGLPVLGVVHAPVLDQTYWASKGSGSWKQMADDPPRRIAVRTAPLDKPTVALGWSSRFGSKLNGFLENLGDHHVLRMGGALKSCLVAEGRADIYPCLGPTGEWDTAAAQCIVEEAGGLITDTKRHKLRYNTRDSMINPNFLVSGNSDRVWSDYLNHN